MGQVVQKCTECRGMSAESKHKETEQDIYEHPEHFLMMYSEHNNISVVQRLLANKTDPNVTDSHGTSALHRAAYGNASAALGALLEAGANINAVDKYGRTALHEACKHGQVDAVRLMLTTLTKDRIEINKKDKAGHTPLHEAAKYGFEDVANMLLEYGAVVDAKSDFGATPLHFAAQAGSEAAVKVLLQFNAMPNAHDRLGVSPLQQAVLQQHKQVVQLLMEASSAVDGDVDFTSLGNSALTSAQISAVVSRRGSVTDATASADVQIEVGQGHLVPPGETEVKANSAQNNTSTSTTSTTDTTATAATATATATQPAVRVKDIEGLEELHKDGDQDVASAARTLSDLSVNDLEQVLAIAQEDK